MSENLRSYTVTLGDGLSVPCVEHGDPAGTPLLLLHGYSDSWRSFEPMLSKFPASIRAIAFTQRGHGEADRPANGYSPEDFAADAVRLLDRLGISRAVIAGHSMGSFIAQRIAIDYPERVSGLVLMGSFPTVMGNAVVDELWREGVSQLEDPVRRDLACDFQRGTVNQPIPDELLETFISESLKVPARVWRAALQGLMNADHTRDLPRIGAPTLIVWGAHDNFFPRSDQDKLLGVIRNAELLLYETAGHSFHWEEPERFARDAAAFVETVAASRVAA
ncbi:alpha/beta hydrolase [Sinorhizobium numidicum]|uniref:Alpha/beta hydrolase n=1 Tax=Sinorhizobium numidicum TaxID=680248 RepID=A0ABY8CVH1_9HYPH|nr:alpha/beta hydrolase [Sinorhizobium numidicum]WEX74737.1 alpha/beta hydrolase [Sinorhizobium numidicum]WEX80728.1 alpha/beta hydrolase [Sinorhizobium numidicum]